MKNESVEVIEVVNQQSEEFPSSFGKTLEKETDEVERKEEIELSVKNELSEKSKENRKHLVKENKPGISENNINVCAKMSDVRQPILVPMYKDIFLSLTKFTINCLVLLF